MSIFGVFREVSGWVCSSFAVTEDGVVDAAVVVMILKESLGFMVLELPNWWDCLIRLG
jgi:hypothetical protein